MVSPRVDGDGYRLVPLVEVDALTVNRYLFNFCVAVVDLDRHDLGVLLE